MTYLYWFTKYAWSDKIWKTDWPFKSGDLLKLWEDYYLVLWKEVSFAEQYVYEIREDISKYQLVEKTLLNKKTIEFIHWMVYWRYAPYYNVIPKLFLPAEIDKLVDRKTTKKKTSFVELELKLWNLNTISLSQNWQNLIVFPDLRTLLNLVDEKFSSQKWVDVLLSSNTQNQKDKSWRNIKNGNTNIALATHSEIFQNYKDLKKIVIVRPHKRYYANQQDPRYKTLDVVKKLSEIRNCELEIVDT